MKRYLKAIGLVALFAVAGLQIPDPTDVSPCEPIKLAWEVYTKQHLPTERDVQIYLAAKKAYCGE